ncbi:hypothetical protein CIHG_05416 [Coccidioides immitis H538.4]|nr:hypothetical protein CIHG_05416 [Coccidioides immitis H538.4]
MAAKGHSNPPGPPPGAFDEVDNRTRGNVIDPKSSHTKQSRNKNRPRNSQSQTPDTGTDLDGDERHGEMVLESRDYEPSQGRHHHREDYRHRRDETPDGYDGEEDEDEGTGTGTSDGGGLCVEVEV